MKQNRPRSIAVLLLLLVIILGCTLRQTKSEGKDKGLESGKAIVDHLDSLFDSLRSKKNTHNYFQEEVVALNENIRQTLERNINSPELLKKIQAYMPKKKHHFSFILSDDGKLGVFSWDTRKKDFPIKNMVFYVKRDRVVPTSLYGSPSLYDQIDEIQKNSGLPAYILGGIKNTTGIPQEYHLSAYIIQRDGIEETRIFPNGESSITIRCEDNKQGPCPEFEHIGNLPKTLSSAIAEQSATFNGREYVFK